MTKTKLYKLSILLLNLCIFLSIISAASIGMDVYANGQNINVEFYNDNTAQSADAISINFRIQNTDSSAVELSDVRFRYYFNDDGLSPVSVFVDYAHINYTMINSCIIYSINEVNSPDANKYIELGYNKAAGALAPNNFSEIRVRVYKTDDGQSFNQTNDYSFCSTNTNYASWDKVTAYVNGIQIFGTEPVILSPVPTTSISPTLPAVPTSTLASTPTPVPTPTQPTPAQSQRPKTTMPANLILKNGDFRDGSEDWIFKCNSISGAVASNVVEDDGHGDMWSKTNILNVGSDYWTVQLIQDGINLESSESYRVSFDAKSSIARDIRVAIRNSLTYTEYFSRTQSIKPGMETYTYEFTMKNPNDQVATLVFSFGKFGDSELGTHEVFLDNVVIEKITLPVSTTPSPKPTDNDVNADIILSRNTVSEAELGTSGDISISHSGELLLDGTISKEKEIVLVIDNSGVLNSYQEDFWTPLDFGIYSNHDLTIQGQGVTVNGSTHANNKFTGTAESIKITETCSASTFDLTSKNIDVNEFINITSPIEMPHFHSRVINEATANYLVFKPEDFFGPFNARPMPGQIGVFIEYNHFYGRFEIKGGGTLIINSSMYFKSDLFISLSKTNNISEGFLVADGNITIQGNDLYPSGPNDRLYVYSINGNIEFQTSNSTINGLVYAPGNPTNPNSGNIYFKGINNTINGSVAGKDLDFSAAGLTVNHVQGQFDSVESKYFESTSYLNSVKDTARALVDLFAGSKNKMSVIQYSDSANNNHFKLYNLSSEKEVNDLKKRIKDIKPETSGYSNMGDGMRRAYHLLNKPPKSQAEKYIIVLAGSEPNRWTSTSGLDLQPKTDDGNARHLRADELLYKSLDYAEDIGSIIAESNIKPIFIDFSPDDIDTVLENIAVSSGAKVITETGKHFYSASNSFDLLRIFDSIYLDTFYDVSLNNVVYEEILPIGVKVLEVPEWMSIETLEIDGITRYKVFGTLDSIPLNFDGEKYTFSFYSFDIKVQFLKPGEILFDGKDAKMIFKVDYINHDDKISSDNVEAHPEDMAVKVTMKIDIT